MPSCIILDTEDGPGARQIRQNNKAHIGAIIGNSTGLGLDGEIVVGWHAVHHRNDAASGTEQGGDHRCVLL